MPLETQLSVFLKNKVGSLSELCTALSEANINIRAMSTVDEMGWGIVGFIVDEIEQAKEILQELGLKFGESTVLTLELDNRPGTLARIARELSEHNINIVHTFATAAGNRSLIVLLTTDNIKAEDLLRLD